jgi:hypothetical protein
MTHRSLLCAWRSATCALNIGPLKRGNDAVGLASAAISDPALILAVLPNPDVLAAFQGQLCSLTDSSRQAALRR